MLLSNFLKKIFENFWKFSQKFSANCVFRPNAQKLTPCPKFFLKFSKFLKNYFKIFLNIFWIFFKIFWIFLNIFWKSFEYFLKIFWKFFWKSVSPPPKKNPGYAHETTVLRIFRNIFIFVKTLKMYTYFSRASVIYSSKVVYL